MQPAAPRRPIRVAILNDFPLVVEGLARIFEHYGSRLELLELAVQAEQISEAVDVVLYDVFAADRRHLTVPAALKPKPKNIKLVLFGWSSDVALIDSGMHHGVDGYIHKSLPANRIVESIERVCRGERVVAMSATGTDHPRPSIGDWPGRSEGLTVRESEVIALITQGHSNADIAKALFLSPNSIKSIIRAAYKKMHVERRGQAVAWGATHGFRPGVPTQQYRIIYPDRSEGRVP